MTSFLIYVHDLCTIIAFAFLILASRHEQGQGMLNVFNGNFSRELYFHLLV